ncbi:MAG TPA: ribosome small subunit-dependent GTPase A [Planctomycetota bacterium]|nr:ribosome small subunit-dependent GTPase A [Planctomycetota bacterium]
MSIDANLSCLGWSPAWALAFQEIPVKENLQPARVSAQHRDLYELRAPAAVWTAELAGRLRHQAETEGVDLPAVGDWVAALPYPNEPRATIHAVLPRRSAFSRKTAGGSPFEQIVAANVDTALLVSGLDDNFNPRRIERYLSLAYESSAMPVIVLNKADLLPTHADREAARREAEAIAPGVPVVLIAASRKDGIDYLRDYLPAGSTAVLLGSSGVGKSTVVNALAGRELLATQEVSAHQSLGRHTTTHRQLVELPHGGLIIDTPGMRELQLWGDESMLARSFASVEELFLQCRFTDCTHVSEPGCAVLAALEAGHLDPDRWSSYHKQQRELQFLARKTNKAAASNTKKKWKARAKAHRAQLRREREREQNR